jgi:hypothetical protein
LRKVPYHTFLEETEERVRKFNSGCVGAACAVFAIGKALKGNVDESDQTIFGASVVIFKDEEGGEFGESEMLGFDELKGVVKQAIHFYETQLIWYRKAINTWSMVGKRVKIVKDLRVLIAKLIWDSKQEARYVFVYK